MAFLIAALAAAAAAQSANPQWIPLHETHRAAPQPTQAAPAATQPTSTTQAKAETSSGTELLTNETIMSLVKAGLGPETVVAKINATRGTYDTSTDALIRLKQADVPDPVIAAMLNRSKSPVLAAGVADNGNPDPMVPHSPGIYVLDPRGSGRMVHIDPTVSNQMKTSNILGYAFTYGLSSAKLKTVIPNATARVQAVGRRPTFYFYFNQSGPLASLSDFNMSFTAVTSSPSEFTLVRFDQKKDHREAAIGSLGFASAKMGVSDKARVAFAYESVASGVYKVTPNADLLPGEYGFVASMGAGTGMVARIFDFSVG